MCALRCEIHFPKLQVGTLFQFITVYSTNILLRSTIMIMYMHTKMHSGTEGAKLYSDSKGVLVFDTQYEES